MTIGVNRSPIRKALFLILGLFLLPAVIAACGGGDDEPLEHISFGRALDVAVTEPELLDEIVIKVGESCDQETGYRLLEVTNPNRSLVAIRVRAINFTSGLIPLFVNSESAELGDPRSDRIFALNPCTAGRRHAAPNGDSDVTHGPILWGTVELEKGFEVKGWMFFDIPKGLNLRAFWWQDPETQTVDYERKQYVK